MKPATGGKTVYGAAVGILMLETRFPRIPGDMGNALTWPFPVLYKVVRGATPDLVVRQGASGLREAFIAAARELVATGADGITTNCGFLAIFQKDIAAAVGVPVATSSLMQVPMVEALLPPGKRAGILTVSAETLTPAHLDAAGVPAGTPIVGTDGGEEFTRALIGNEWTLDVAKAEADVLAAGRELVAAHADIGAIVLECTNMMPYAARLRAELGLPVFSIASMVCWFQAGLTPCTYENEILDTRPLSG
ncbi:FIG01073400: hypothetical protein [hydrothermal vent metagenome]|uniref:Aspartate/glutamate racemase family protein n=1 Tax=hydrothermal vent metagenome TaxID=652676 RepID=A0A3B0TN41_9ZZZZ